MTQSLILGRLDRRRFEPIVIAPMDGAALARYRKMGIKCIVSPPEGALSRYGGAALRDGLLGRLRSAFQLLRYNLTMARLFKQQHIEVVYANCVRAQLSIGFAAWLAGAPSLLYVKGELANPLIDRLCFVLASKILFFCPQNRDDRYPHLVRLFRSKIGILRIGLDPAVPAAVRDRDFAPLRRELDIHQDSLNTMVLGQLYHPKGQHLAIEALSRLVRDFPNARLYLVGDHVIDEYRPYKAELEALIRRHGLSGHVRFTEWRKDALEIASLMDVILHPSLAEGFGRAVLEAMALGRPVIASAVGGLREAIKDGQNGFLVPPGDVESIAARWRELLSDAGLRRRLGEEARRTVFADYLIDDKVARLADIWAEMASRRDCSCAA